MPIQQSAILVCWLGCTIKQTPSATIGGTARHATITAVTIWRRRFIEFTCEYGLFRSSGSVIEITLTHLREINFNLPTTYRFPQKIRNPN